MGLEEGLRALEANRWEAAFSELAGAWRETRCPGLAAEIERLQSHATAALPAIEGANRKLQVAWEKAFGERRTVLLGPLLAVFDNGNSKELKARMARLADLPPDPRITPALVCYAETCRLSSTGARPAWTAFFRLCLHVGDPRVRPGLDVLRAWAAGVVARSKNPEWCEFETYVVTQVDKVLPKLPEAGACPDLDRVRAAVDRAVSRPFREGEERGAADLAALEARVLEDPSDDGALQVWADALAEAGDDRGTFVSLQLAAEARKPTGKERTAVKKLLAANLTTWLGPLGVAVDPKLCRFRRGLLEVAHAKPARLSKDVLALPGWRSVEQLHSSVAHLRHPALISLNRVGTCLLPDADDVRGPVGFHVQAGEFLAWPDVMELAEGFPAGVRHLEVDGQDAAASQIQRVASSLPDLDLLAVRFFRNQEHEPFAPLLARSKAVVLEASYGWTPPDAATWLERLPGADLHLMHGAWKLVHSWLRRDGGLHLVLTETGSAGLIPDDERERHLTYRGPAELDRRYGFLLESVKRAPGCDSVVVRQRGPWHPEDVERFAAATAHFRNVELPRARTV